MALLMYSMRWARGRDATALRSASRVLFNVAFERISTVLMAVCVVLGTLQPAPTPSRELLCERLRSLGDCAAIFGLAVAAQHAARPSEDRVCPRLRRSVLLQGSHRFFRCEDSSRFLRSGSDRVNLHGQPRDYLIFAPAFGLELFQVREIAGSKPAYLSRHCRIVLA